MRLLYFTRRWTTHDERFVRGFERHGVDVGTLCLDGNAAPVDSARIEVGGERGGPAGALNDDGLKQAIAAYRVVEQRFSPDLVLAGPVGDCAYIKSEAATGVPLVSQSWAFDVFWEAERDERVRRRTAEALQRSYGFFYDCHAVLVQALTIAERVPERRFCMPWGLEQPMTLDRTGRTRARHLLGISSETIFLYTRGFADVYAPEVLLAAWATIARGINGLVLWLAGDGPVMEQMARLITESGLTGSTRMFGRLGREQLAQLYGAADYYVSSSRCDGTSVSLLEAMSAGLTCIVSSAGGNPEWITDGENGYVFESGSPASLAAAMSRALADECREIFAAKSQGLVRQKADFWANFPYFLQFLNSVK